MECTVNQRPRRRGGLRAGLVAWCLALVSLGTGTGWADTTLDYGRITVAGGASESTTYDAQASLTESTVAAQQASSSYEVTPVNADQNAPYAVDGWDAYLPENR